MTTVADTWRQVVLDAVANGQDPIEALYDYRHEKDDIHATYAGCRAIVNFVLRGTTERLAQETDHGNRTV